MNNNVNDIKLTREALWAIEELNYYESNWYEEDFDYSFVEEAIQEITFFHEIIMELDGDTWVPSRKATEEEVNDAARGYSHLKFFPETEEGQKYLRSLNSRLTNQRI